MSPESLDSLKFCEKSDVYSFGVVLYEIFSIMESPWKDRVWTSNFSVEIRNGLRLSKPAFATRELYEYLLYDYKKLDK
jgi:serine/threonine protein kinase